MGTEESSNNAAPTTRSWLWNLIVCPCGAETSGCGCLCPFLHCGRRDTRPTGWFEVQDGQLHSNTKPKPKKRKRRKKKRSRSVPPEMYKNEDANTDAIINRPTSIASHASKSGDTGSIRTNAKRPNIEDRGAPVSDLLKHLLRAAQDVSSQSSAPPSCDDTTPLLLRSDEHDRYQPDVVMEIASSPQTEGELEHSIRDQCL